MDAELNKRIRDRLRDSHYQRVREKYRYFIKTIEGQHHHQLVHPVTGRITASAFTLKDLKEEAKRVFV